MAAPSTSSSTSHERRPQQELQQVKKRHGLEASKPAPAKSGPRVRVDVHESRLGDVIGDLEALHAETLNDMRTLSLRLNLLAKMAVLMAAAIADAHAKESSRMLCELLAVENPPLPRRRVRKGAERGPG